MHLRVGGHTISVGLVVSPCVGSWHLHFLTSGVVSCLYLCDAQALRLLSNGEVMLKTASDFKGSVVGETEQLTKGILRMGQGKVVVVDEAYNLSSTGGSGDGSGLGAGANYGALALDTLVEKLQAGGDIAVILIGYKRQMLDMLDNANPGLRSRFDPASALEFEDYSDTELTQILTRAARSSKVGAASAPLCCL